MASQAIAPGLAAMAIPEMWLDCGADLERDVLPTVRRLALKRPGGRIKSWDYFTDAVAEAKARRERGLPSIAFGAQPSADTHRPLDFRAERQRKNREFCKRIGVEVEDAA